MTEQLENIIKTYNEENYLSGNLFISKGGKELFSKSFGQASVQLHVPNHLNTKFHIASVTKMFIATAVLKLYEQGLIDLEEHPGAYVGKCKELHPHIKIHHLLSHSSGIHDIYAVPNLRFEMSKLRIEKQDFVDYLIRLPQDFSPGERWGYSSTGYIMLGYMLEAVTGMQYDQIFHEWFFSPLAMKSTGIDHPRKVNADRAYGHALEDGKITNADHDRLSEIDAPGEFYSTVRDLDAWCTALFNGELLQQETMEKMFSPYYTTTFDPHLNYGYGWFLGSDFRLIGGGTPGFRSEIWYYPADDLRIMMLWNYEKVDSHQLLRLIKPAIFHRRPSLR